MIHYPFNQRYNCGEHWKYIALTLNNIYIMNTSLLINILTKSVEKNGSDYVLTLGHLLNIIKLIDKIEKKNYLEEDIYPFDPNWD